MPRASTLTASFAPVVLTIPLGLLLFAGPAQAAPPVPAAGAPTLVELCAATSVGEVDELLADVAATDLVDALAPLATLTVPQGSDDLVLDADVTLGEVREALGCTVDPDPTDPTDPTTDPTTGPTTPADPTTPTAPSTGDQDDDPTPAPDSVDPTADDGTVADTSGDQVITVPDGSVDTGSR